VEIVQLVSFRKEIAGFPLETREDIFSLVYRFLKGERLNSKEFKTFKIDKNTKILEFKIKDDRGNWRAVSTILQGKYLVFVYAFHKKSQELQEKDKDVIRSRIRRIEI
jgi:phage-related protein